MSLLRVFLALDFNADVEERERKMRKPENDEKDVGRNVEGRSRGESRREKRQQKCIQQKSRQTTLEHLVQGFLVFFDTTSYTETYIFLKLFHDQLTHMRRAQYNQSNNDFRKRCITDVSTCIL